MLLMMLLIRINIKISSTKTQGLFGVVIIFYKYDCKRAIGKTIFLKKKLL